MLMQWVVAPVAVSSLGCAADLKISGSFVKPTDGAHHGDPESARCARGTHALIQSSDRAR
jgi:hypothetical protein